MAPAPATLGLRDGVSMPAVSWTVRLVLCVAAATFTIGLPRDGAAGQEPRLKSSVDLVALDICVRDGQGHLVSDLAAQDFVVLENGAPQQVAMLSASHDVPIDAVLLVDRSSSMTGEKDVQARAAARAFAATLQPDDRLEVLGFNGRVGVVRPFAALSAGLGLAAWPPPSGETALFDALAVATSRFARLGASPDRRRVLVLLSDGEDTGSILDADALLPEIRRSGAVLYAVRTPDNDNAPVPWWLAQFASDTGGEARSVADVKSLPDWFRRIGEEVRTLYRLGYVSSDPRRDGSWRTVNVRVPAVAGRVRTRAGYYAPSEHGLRGGE